MRRYIGPLVILGIFVILLIVVLVTQNQSNTTTGSTQANRTPVPTNTVSAADRELQVFSLDANAAINQLEIKTVTSTATLKFENNAWQQTAPSPLALDSAVVSDTMRQLVTLRANEVIPDDKAGNLTAFGLDKPTLTANLGFNNGSPKTLLVGALNQSTSNYYVKLADGPKVWSVSSFYVDTLQTWLTKPPVPAPTIAPVAGPLTPLPSVTPSPSPGATTAAATTAAVTSATTAAVTTAAATTAAATTSGATTAAVSTTASTTTAATTTVTATPTP